VYLAESALVTDVELLRRFSPVLRYDTHEAFFADHPDVFVGLDTVTLDGARVTLADLHGPRAGCDSDTRLADSDHDYRAQARAGHANPQLRDRCFGRVARDHDGRRWLQYWFFYLYNDAGLGGRFGLHEGDWETVQLRLGDGDEPDRAVYAQHDYAEARAWEDVEREGGDGPPIVYPARGTHAAYFERGVHRTQAWWDIADGEGPHVRPTLEEIADPPAPWLLWPGRWGGTKPRLPPLDSWSPRGPGCHAQWDDAARLLDKAHGHERLDAPAAPAVGVRRDGTGLRIDFDFGSLPGGDAAPDRLVLTIAGDGETPVVETLVVDTLDRGTVHLRRGLDPQRTYRVQTSTIAGDGMPTQPGPPTVLDPAPERTVAGILRAGLDVLDRLWNGVKRRVQRR
jgi:hypothetical protein